MKKVHVLSFITAGLSIYAILFLSGLYAFLIDNSPNRFDPLKSNYRFAMDVVPEYLHGLWYFYEDIQPHFALITIALIFLLALSIFAFLISMDPKKTVFIRTSVEMVVAILVVATYLIFLVFQGIRQIVPDPYRLLSILQTTVILLGALLLIKHLFAKVRLGIFRRSTLMGMLKKPSKEKPVSDDVKDLKDALGIRGLNAPWIKPFI